MENLYKKKYDGKPLITVLLPTHNESPEIVEKAIKSILKQTYGNFELFVFDDSTDKGTIHAINVLSSDGRMSIFRKKGGIGYIKSLNMGIRRAKGKYIARMDGDDISFPDRFQIQVDYLENHRDVGVVGGQLEIIDENDKVTSYRHYPVSGIRLWLYSTIRSPIAHPTAMMRREIFDKDIHYKDGAEDLDLWLQIMNKGYKINNVPDTVLKFRVQDNFGEKRTEKGRLAITKARIVNFSWHRLVFSVLSIFWGTIQGYMPMSLLRAIYNKENGRS